MDLGLTLLSHVFLPSKYWDLAFITVVFPIHRQTTYHFPPSSHTIGSKWVFCIKENVDGSVNKYKFGLIAKGFHQVHGFDFHETSSPVIKNVTKIITFTLALTRNWPIKQFDVNNAFFNGLLEEEVYNMEKHMVIDLFFVL